MTDRISLKTLEASIPVNVADLIALSDADLRKIMARAVTAIFIKTNVVVLGVLIILVIMDIVMIYKGTILPEQRLVDGDILMALVGATTVQLAAIMVAISNYLFPSPKTGQK
jgi:hypothetical protein